MHFTLELRIPTVGEYQLLRASTGWDALDDATVAKALSNTCFAACVMLEGQIIASGRIIGDGAYFYIQDLIVLPDYQHKGLGLGIMEALENWLAENAPNNAFIGLMAAKGVKEFYSRLGYEERGSEKPGMFKIIKNQIK